MGSVIMANVTKSIGLFVAVSVVKMTILLVVVVVVNVVNIIG